MNFYTLQKAPIDRKDVIFRASWTTPLAASIFGAVPALAIAILFVVESIRSRDWFGMAFSLVALFAMLFVAWLVVRWFRSTFHEQNWLVRVQQDGRILVKFRSFLNRHFPQDREIVFDLRPNQIEWIRKARENRLTLRGTRHAQGIRSEAFASLEIKPRFEDLIALEDRLHDERTMFMRDVSSEHPYYPVRIMEGGIIRIEWQWTRPSVRRALQIISNMTRIKVQAEHKEVNDLAKDPGQDRQREDRVLELIEVGDRIAAASLVQEIYGYSLSDAMKFISDLEGRPSKSN